MIQLASSINNEAPEDPWFVVWTEARAEKKVAARFGAAGREVWLPTYISRRQWSDRWREVEVPLFPGYLFARSGRVSWPQVLRTPGVLTIVKERGKPALLADSLVSGLRRAIGAEGAAPEVVSKAVDYNPGDEVIVQEGALSGVRGIVREQRSRRQLVIWVTEIGRGVALTIGPTLVRPV